MKNAEQIALATTDLVNVAVAAIPQLDQLASESAIQRFHDFITPNIEAAESLEVNNTDEDRVAEMYAIAISPFLKAWEDGRKTINRTLKETVDGRLIPERDRLQKALDTIKEKREAFHQKLAEEARERQRKFDEEKRKADAELARRQKIQDAAVAAGKEARQEIPQEVERTEIIAPTPTAMNRRITYRVEYTVIDESALPDAFVVKTPNRAKLNETALALNDTIAKSRKGIDDLPQNVPGVEFTWKRVYRNG